MAINMMCMNTKCKYYWEDNCTRNLDEIRIEINEDGKCITFEHGESDWYKEEGVLMYNYIIMAWWTTHREDDVDYWLDRERFSALNWCKTQCTGYDYAMVVDSYGEIIYKQTKEVTNGIHQ